MPSKRIFGSPGGNLNAFLESCRWIKKRFKVAQKTGNQPESTSRWKRAEAATTRDELRRIFLEVNDGAKAGRCSTSEATDLRSFVNNLAAVLPEPVEGVVV